MKDSAPDSGGLEIISSPLNEMDYFNKGVCFRNRPVEARIDTIIIHSMYISDDVVNPVLRDEVSEVSEASAHRIAYEWRNTTELLAQNDAPELRQRSAELESLALHLLIASRCGAAALSPYSIEAAKELFQFQGVSSHYIIDRDGRVYELVKPELLAFHAGKSVMPRPDDGRESVNSFSIGVELFATKESGMTEQQYHSLEKLTKSLMARFKITNFYGHSDVAPVRKTDPHNFDWPRYKRSFGFSADKHHAPSS